MKPLISFAVCTHNEGHYVQNLLHRLLYALNMLPDGTGEIVVVDDYSTGETLDILQAQPQHVRIVQHSLNGDYAAHKNFMNSQCQGAWILNLDADEYVEPQLIESLPDIIELNPFIDAYWMPRINTVEGLTDAHIKRWGWRMTQMYGIDLPVVNWPDPQMRFYRNVSKIRWEGKVHERLTGYDSYAEFPHENGYAIRHFKKIDRQEAQNSYYDTLLRGE